MFQLTSSALKIFFSAVVLCLSTSSFAQKFAHINYGNLLEGLPEIQEADKVIIAYQDSLKFILRDMDSKLKADFQENKTKYEQGILSQVEVNEINLRLSGEQQKLIQLSEVYEQAIFAKREQILAPILSRINEVIAQYGKQEGYSAIFDESRGDILYDEAKMDITEIIRGLLVSQ